MKNITDFPKRTSRPVNESLLLAGLATGLLASCFTSIFSGGYFSNLFGKKDDKKKQEDDKKKQEDDERKELARAMVMLKQSDDKKERSLTDKLLISCMDADGNMITDPAERLELLKGSMSDDEFEKFKEEQIEAFKKAKSDGTMDKLKEIILSIPEDKVAAAQEDLKKDIKLAIQRRDDEKALDKYLEKEKEIEKNRQDELAAAGDDEEKKKEINAKYDEEKGKAQDELVATRKRNAEIVDPEKAAAEARAAAEKRVNTEIKAREAEKNKLEKETNRSSDVKTGNERHETEINNAGLSTNTKSSKGKANKSKSDKDVEIKQQDYKKVLVDKLGGEDKYKEWEDEIYDKLEKEGNLEDDALENEMKAKCEAEGISTANLQKIANERTNPKDEEVGDEDVEDDDAIDDGGKEVKDEDGKVLKNPSKVWKKRKLKNGNGLSKSYYNKKGDSISDEEFKKKKQHFQERLAKTNESFKISLRDYILEKQCSKKFVSLRNYILS